MLAGLLSFPLSPLVRRLERWHLGRIGAVLVTTTLAFVLIGGLTYLVTSQFLDLGSLPKYRSNLIARVTALKTHENNPLRRAVQTIGEVTAALNEAEETAPKPAAAEQPRPVRGAVVRTADSSLQMLIGVLWPVVAPVANTSVVIVIVIFMLLAGDDLRDRLIHLMGRGRLRVTTQALDDAGQRISRYLRAQLLVNASFGPAIGIGLYYIGIPNAVFWGLLSMVLRFLPYIGPWLAAGFPLKARGRPAIVAHYCAKRVKVEDGLGLGTIGCPRNRRAKDHWLRLFGKSGNQIRPASMQDAISEKRAIMTTFHTFTTLTVALFAFAACDSKVESSRKDALESKADALENKADAVRKDAKTDATGLEKQAAVEADAAKDAAKARAEAEKKTAEQDAESLRKAAEQAAKNLEDKAKETREQK